jgi:hypothetical protein
MKARKTLKNQALIQEVISQISQRFAPKIPDIKKASISSHEFVNGTNILTNRLSKLFSRKNTSSAWMDQKTPLPTWPKKLLYSTDSITLLCSMYSSITRFSFFPHSYAGLARLRISYHTQVACNSMSPLSHMVPILVMSGVVRA